MDSNKLKILLVATVMGMAFSSTYCWPMISIKDSCPNKFIGTVLSVKDQSSEDSKNLIKLQIVFKNQKIIRGHVSEKVKLTILKNSALQMVEGRFYQIETRDNRLCQVTELMHDQDDQHHEDEMI